MSQHQYCIADIYDKDGKYLGHLYAETTLQQVTEIISDCKKTNENCDLETILNAIAEKYDYSMSYACKEKIYL